ncbi:MAG: lipopolysaccharide core heptose(II) kinase RfaY [Enterobacterales bacterium endosymbiont of Blomia tropicalis]|nr:lipopolysaccharide core heptose(II) kinase RfaY [Mixta mediterraneensis]MDL4914482.1 lipopolysaccharide core heptose(II) kinase RfaY [Mixta mediterraneensis]
MVSGDPHKGNFIISDNGLRLIDLSGKKINKMRIAKDYIDLERHLGINAFHKGFFYHWVKKKSQFRKRFKAFKLALKGK